MVLDLGDQPLSGTFPTPAEAAAARRVPLRLAVCRACWWLQLADDTPDEPDTGGPPAAATSSSIRQHAEELAAWLVGEQEVRPEHRILELASHGNVLAGFLRNVGLLHTTTVERHPSAVATARAQGLAITEGRLDSGLARRLAADGPFDLVLDTFDLSHRRTPHDELAGIARAIDGRGFAVVEVEHALPLLEAARFDSIRHGHFGYPSLIALRPAVERAGLEVVAALRTAVYGGSLRVVLAKAGTRTAEASVQAVLDEERGAGVDDPGLYDAFATRVGRLTTALRDHLVAARDAGRRVMGYGAPSRAATLLNVAGVDASLLPYTADVSPAKHGREIPGTSVQIVEPARLVRDQPDEILILAWPIADEVVRDLQRLGIHSSRFVVPLPELRVIDR
jgi:hypothetical protein